MSANATITVVAGTSLEAGDLVFIGMDRRAYRVTGVTAQTTRTLRSATWRDRLRAWARWRARLAWLWLQDCWHATGGDE